MPSIQKKGCRARAATAGAVVAVVTFGSVMVAGAATVVIRPGAMGSWGVDRVHCDGGTPTGSTELVDGPAAPPLGSGSLNFEVGADGDSAEVMRNPSYAGVRVDQLTALTYATYVTANTGGQSAYLSIDIDLDGTLSTMEDRLIFEPYYQGPPTQNPSLPTQGPLVTGAWQTWDALIGGWWSNDPGDDVSPGTGVKSLAHYVALAGKENARVMNAVPAGGFKIVAGCGNPSWNGFVGAADALTIGTSVGSDTFDFERILAPVITSPLDGSTVGSGFTVSGTGPANQGLRLEDDGVQIATTSINGSGAWSIGLSEQSGSLALRAFATDANANSSPPSNLVNLTVDASVPSSPVILVPSEGQVLPTTSVTISGTGPPGLTVHVRKVSPAPVWFLGSVVPDGSGAWSISTTLNDGIYTVQAISINGVGTPSAPAVRSFRVKTDGTAPLTPVIRRPENDTFHPALVTISGDGEIGSTVTVKKGPFPVGTAVTQPNGTWTMQVVMSTGRHTIVAVAGDGSGNVSPESNAVTFEVDADAPTVTITTGDLTPFFGPPQIQGTAADNNSVARVEIQAFDLLGAQVFRGDATLAVPGGSPTLWEAHPQVGLTGIISTIRATAFDAVGNRSGAGSIRVIAIGG